MYTKIYKEEGKILIAACDEDIIGKKFSEGELLLHVREDFYKGERMDLDKLEDLLGNANIANLTGNKVVERAIDAGFVDEKNVIIIQGIKHAQIVEI
ncbi:MAG: DUF424 domain-containing protein [Candidatus Altiarchaeales archaeon]|nr:MAG: DUF424 domain-containing protein [Candidatus Altiarchaeales archaeon]